MIESDGGFKSISFYNTCKITSDLISTTLTAISAQFSPPAIRLSIDREEYCGHIASSANRIFENDIHYPLKRWNIWPNMLWLFSALLFQSVSLNLWGGALAIGRFGVFQKGTLWLKADSVSLADSVPLPNLPTDRRILRSWQNGNAACSRRKLGQPRRQDVLFCRSFHFIL